MNFTQTTLGITCALALAIGASPAAAQSRERAPQRHGSSRQVQPARQSVSRDVRVRSVRGPDRVVTQRSITRTFRGPDGFRGGYVRSYSPSRYAYSSRGYGGRSIAVQRHYEQRRHGGRVYSRGYNSRYYRPYYRSYYPRSRFYYGYGYGWGYPYSFGGYPYLYPGFYGHGWGYGYPYGPYGYPYYRSGYAEDQGGIRLQMKPKQAEVFADGYYVGTVDDFDGISQRLALEAGHHKLEVRADGFEPFAIDVNILREQTIKYKGELRPRP